MQTLNNPTRNYEGSIMLTEPFVGGTSLLVAISLEYAQNPVYIYSTRHKVPP